MRVDVRVLFHALSSRVCLDISKVQAWELLEEPQSSRSAWIQLLRKGAVCAQAVAGSRVSCPGSGGLCNRQKVKLMYAERITENRKLV